MTLMIYLCKIDIIDVNPTTSLVLDISALPVSTLKANYLQVDVVNGLSIVAICKFLFWSLADSVLLRPESELKVISAMLI